MSHKRDPNLTCHGCAHSAAGAPFPGHPSGERPCFFCVRNPEREKWVAEAIARDRRAGDDRHPANGAWYDGSKAVRVPMDCYHTCDMKDQMRRWDAPNAAFREFVGRLCDGGAILSTGQLTTEQITQARAEGRLFVIDDGSGCGFGYVHFPRGSALFDPSLLAANQSALIRAVFNALSPPLPDGQEKR